MSDRDDEDDTKEANTDRQAPQLGLPIDAPKSDGSPKLREPRMTRTPSFSAPANDRPGGDRARLSAPPRADGGLFDRQPPPFRRPSSAPPPLPHATNGGASSNKTALPETPNSPTANPERAQNSDVPERAVPELGKPVVESREPTRQEPEVTSADRMDSSPPKAAERPAARPRPEPRATSDFQDLPEPPRPRLSVSDETAPVAQKPHPATKPQEAPVKPAATVTPEKSIQRETPMKRQAAAQNPSLQKPSLQKAPQQASPQKPSPRSSEQDRVREEPAREPTPLRPRRGADGSGAAKQKAQARPVLIAKNEGLIVHSLGKQFKKRPVLRDVSLRVQRGEAVGLLGPNGAGKTTCFYIVTGLISADYGQIVLDGVDITELPMYRRSRLGIGYLPQESSIFRGLTVEQNIMAVLELIEKNRERREITLENLLAEFSISHLRRTPAIALSGGERRRLEIARALASQPNFVLLDEPLAGIDPIAVRDIRELVSHLKDRGIGVLITDHNVRETLDIVDRAYILHDGNVLMEGTPDEIVANQEVRRVYLGDRFSL